MQVDSAVVHRRRVRLRWAAAVVGAVLVAGCGVDATSDVEASTAAESTSPGSGTITTAAGIPLRLVDGSVPVVMVAVGGGPEVPLLLDTGSAGLRIFVDDVGPQAVADPATEDETISFVDGTTYVSDKAIAPVTLGGVALPAPVPVALVKDVTCEPDASSCEPGIAASKAAGVHGILGVDMDTGDYTLPSPLLYVPEYRSFTVAYADDGSGQLLPGVPSSADTLARWDLLPAESGIPDVAGWAQDFDACWSVDNKRPECVPTTFDTGATDLVIPPTLPGAPEPASADEYMSVSDGPIELFADRTDDEPVWRLEPGDEVSTSAYVAPDGDSGYDGVLAGTPLFFAFDVGYDHANGQIGLWPRTD